MKLWIVHKSFSRFSYFFWIIIYSQNRLSFAKSETNFLNCEIPKWRTAIIRVEQQSIFHLSLAISLLLFTNRNSVDERTNTKISFYVCKLSNITLSVEPSRNYAHDDNPFLCSVAVFIPNKNIRMRKKIVYHGCLPRHKDSCRFAWLYPTYATRYAFCVRHDSFCRCRRLLIIPIYVHTEHRGCNNNIVIYDVYCCCNYNIKVKCMKVNRSVRVYSSIRIESQMDSFFVFFFHFIEPYIYNLLERVWSPYNTIYNHLHSTEHSQNVLWFEFVFLCVY